MSQSISSAGDRWLRGESLHGVRFAQHDPVRIVAGTHEGAIGTVALLVQVAPHAVYRVQLRDESRVIRVRDDELEPS